MRLISLPYAAEAANQTKTRKKKKMSDDLIPKKNE